MNWLAPKTVAQLWSTINTGLNWSLLWIDTRILAVGLEITEIIVGKVKKRVAMRFTNDWK